MNWIFLIVILIIAYFNGNWKPVWTLEPVADLPEIAVMKKL